MKFAIFGAGGVGGYFGAKLAAAGNEAHFIARGAHLDAIRKNGLKLLSAGGDVTVKPALATDDPAAIGPVDCVLMCVKLWDLDKAAEAARPLVAGGGYVLPLQNGVDAAQRCAAALGAGKAIGGTAHVATAIAAPGVIKHTGTMAKLQFGEVDGRVSLRVERLAKACREAGIDAAVPDSIETALWMKFVFLASTAGWTALTRRPMGALRADPDIRLGVVRAFAEVVAVGRAAGVKLPSDAEQQAMAILDRVPAEMQTSMQHDLVAGNRLEVPWLSGAVARMGAELKVPTPTHDVLYAGLKPYAGGVKR
ncbi:MAG: ketopantoate reductase family protein [Rhodospirillales bacterium]